MDKKGGKHRPTDKTRVSVTMSNVYGEGLDQLVESGLYASRQEVILEGLRWILGDYGIKPFPSLIVKKPFEQGYYLAKEDGMFRSDDGVNWKKWETDC